MDLIFAAGVNAIVAVACGWLGWRVGDRFRGAKSRPLALLAALLWLLVAVYLLRDRLFWARLLPLPCVLTLTDPVPSAAVFLATLVASLLSGSTGHRGRFAFGLGLLGLCTGFSPDFGVTPRTAYVPHWQNGVCLQSSEVTCGPSSAATLLRTAGITSTEAEMVGLCHATRLGTSLLGIYRGLRVKTENSPWSVRVLTTSSRDEIFDAAKRHPVFISVFFRPVAGGRASYLNNLTEAKHAVVLLGVLPDGRVAIGDPLSGQIIWTAEEFAAHWAGEGLQLVPRNE